MMPIKSMADIRSIEAMGFATFCPHPSPQKIIEASAAEWPDRIALHYLVDANNPEQDRRWTYRELADDVTAAARGFRALGLEPGGSVALLANHTPMAEIALWGAQIAGTAIPINPLLRPAHIASLLKAANAKIIVMMGVNDEQEYWSDLVPELRAQGVNLPILDCDSARESPGAADSLEALIERERGKPLGFEVHGGDSSIAALYHTGGTTGAPKLVRHTRRNEAHVACSCALLHDYGPGDIVVNGFPLFHVAGAFVYGLSALSKGSTVLIPGRLGMRNAAFVGSFWKQAERHGITIIAAVPTILSGLMAVPIDADISKIRSALTGGSPLPTELAASFEEKTGIPVRNIFGMTETAGAIALESVHAPRMPHCCGFPLPFSEAAILENGTANPDMSRRLAVGETGLVVVRGPNVSPGYTDSTRDAGTFLEDGWLATGDLGHVDKQGRLYLTGRAKDVIIRGSHNIDPQSIENALMAHPDVESAAAVGMPDAYAGELPVVFAKIRDGALVSEGDLLDFLKGGIEEPAAMPKRLELIDTMPLTPVGKIFKPALRREAIRWAIESAASKAGIARKDYSLEIGENLAVEIKSLAKYAEAIREAVVGMPINITIQDR